MMKYFLTTTQIAEAYFNLCQTNKNSALCISCTDEQPIQYKGNTNEQLIMLLIKNKVTLILIKTTVKHQF